MRCIAAFVMALLVWAPGVSEAGGKLARVGSDGEVSPSVSRDRKRVVFPAQETGTRGQTIDKVVLGPLDLSKAKSFETAESGQPQSFYLETIRKLNQRLRRGRFSLLPVRAFNKDRLAVADSVPIRYFRRGTWFEIKIRRREGWHRLGKVEASKILAVTRVGEWVYVKTFTRDSHAPGADHNAKTWTRWVAMKSRKP
jgi:hypothetical protein